AYPKDLPQGMISKKIIFPSIIESRLPNRASSSPHWAVVKKYPFREGPGFPAFHSCGANRNPIKPAPLDRFITTYLFETFAPEQLAGTEHVAVVVETVF